MKVVLFCGGLGMRLREYSEAIPKPLVPIGHQPVLWHIMKYYAHFGHKDFILCLGWQGSAIKEYFLNYNECLSSNFVYAKGGTEIELLNTDIAEWTITFVDTGATSSIGERLHAVRDYLKEEDVFLANYADGLTDLHLPDLIDFHNQQQAVATFLGARPQATFHVVESSPEGRVLGLRPIGQENAWMNAGYFVLDQEIFSYLREGEDLVLEPFARLIAEERLFCMKYSGFWSCMDTYKEKQQLDALYEQGRTPWQVWKEPPQINNLQAVLDSNRKRLPR
jgi:glucose-1-phosphate cytidylyltransferase